MSPPLNCSSESVGVDGVSAEVHQLVNSLLKLLIDGGGPRFDVLQAADGLFSAVGHVDDQLVIGDEGEADVSGDHGLLGVVVSGGVFLPHVYKIIVRGLVANPLNLKRT